MATFVQQFKWCHNNMNNAEFEKNLFIGSVISFSSLMLAKI